VVNSLISILVPTRGRPESVFRLINSINSTASRKDLVEILFYVDHDDDSFPSSLDLDSNVKVIRGERVWISLAWNCLFAHSQGEILMYTGDDVVFETQGWDEEVRTAFTQFPDSLGLVFGDDGGWYAGKLAINGFVHRAWADLLGYFTYPARVSAIDLWIHECAAYISRVVYLEKVMFRHVHNRQGDATAKFDETYKDAYDKSVRWGIMDSYDSLSRERRIDKIILSRKIGQSLPFEFKYLLAIVVCKFLEIFRGRTENQDRILSFDNHFMLKRILLRIIRRRSNILNTLS
jgi:glycosyltransferase involved in cell wall biosynthesis